MSELINPTGRESETKTPLRIAPPEKANPVSATSERIVSRLKGFFRKAETPSQISLEDVNQEFRSISAPLSSPESHEPIIREVPENKRIISSQDALIIQTATENLIGQFKQDFAQKLPDAIVLPDTSARPLAYLLKPIMDELAAERGVKPPELLFFKTEKSGYFMNSTDLTDVKAKLKADTESLNEQEKITGSDYDSRYVLESEARGIAEAEAMQLAHETRASEILDRIRKEGQANPTIALFDDYISNRTTTVREVRRAFHDSALPAYGLITPHEGSSDTNIHYGLLDPYIDAATARGGGESNGLHYRRKDNSTKELSIGVTKNTPGEGPRPLYSTPITEGRDEAAMKALRNEMAEIGHKVTEGLKAASNKTTDTVPMDATPIRTSDTNEEKVA